MQCAWAVDLFLLSSEIKSLGIISQYSGPILQSLSCFNFSMPWGARLPVYLPWRIWEQMRRSLSDGLAFNVQPERFVECLSMCGKEGMYVLSIRFCKMEESLLSLHSRTSTCPSLCSVFEWKTISCVRAEERKASLEWERCHSQPWDGFHFMFVTCSSYL